MQAAQEEHVSVHDSKSRVELPSPLLRAGRTGGAGRHTMVHLPSLSCRARACGARRGT